MILVCGEALFDLFLGDAPLDSDGTFAMQAVAGGSPYNIAIGLARLGAQVALGTDLARDALGQRLAERLAKEGVDDRFMRRTAGATAMALISVSTDGFPTYAFRGLDEPFFAPLEDRVLDAQAGLSGLHVGSVSLVLPNSASILRGLARKVADHVMVSLDPNVRLAIEPDPSHWREMIDEVRQWARVVKVSVEDIALAYGPEADPHEMCGRWLSGRTELVALTRGEAGASLFTRTTGRTDLRAAPSTVVDTVGAGDSFMAALLAVLSREGWLVPGRIEAQSADKIAALGRFATAAAALTCARRGPVLPSRSDVEERLTVGT